MTLEMEKHLRNEFWIQGGLYAAVPDMLYRANRMNVSAARIEDFIVYLKSDNPHYFESGMEGRHYDSRRKIIENREREAAV